jgi:protein gp37
MGENSKIEWCDHTFNPWIGCTEVSPACDHCYARTEQQDRYHRALWGNHSRVRTSDGNWDKPARWNRDAGKLGKRQKVFCASLADVFDNQVDDAWRQDLWDLICVCPDLDWLLLTKRPQNMAAMLPPDWGHGWPNVWLGTTVENQEEADRRIPHLLRVPAMVHFLSCEPLLGPLDLSLHMGTWPIRDPSKHRTEWDSAIYNEGIGWVICGQESGPHARETDLDWERSIRDQCANADTPFFLKQHVVDGRKIPTPKLDGVEHRAMPS